MAGEIDSSANQQEHKCSGNWRYIKSYLAFILRPKAQEHKQLDNETLDTPESQQELEEEGTHNGFLLSVVLIEWRQRANGVLAADHLQQQLHQCRLGYLTHKKEDSQITIRQAPFRHGPQLGGKAVEKKTESCETSHG